MKVKRMLEGKIEELRKLRETCLELENEIYDHIESTYKIKDDLLDVLEAVVDSVEQFDDVDAIMKIISALGSKPSSAKSSKHGKKKKSEGSLL
jgi:hypothetical protein